MPIFLKLSFRPPDPGLELNRMKMRTYRCIGLSGDIAFYDRVVDVNEII